MYYYCAMVKTGGEEVFKKDFYRLCSDRFCGVNAYFLKRKVKLNGRLKGQSEQKPLFPGYVFISVPEPCDDFFLTVKSCINFFHFLNSNTDIQELKGKDLGYLSRLLAYGEVSGLSKVKFDENDRIQIVSGPLEGFKGNIIRVDRRRQRVTVSIDMCGISSFDLCYEVVAKI